VAGIEVARPFAGTLPESCADTWRKAVDHPFVRAVADGSLPAARFHTWIRQDRHFVEALARFVRALTTLAPTDDVAGLESGLAALGPELDLFASYAEHERIRLDVPALTVCHEYVGFLLQRLDDGYPHALTAYYACERSYLDAWTSVRRSGGAAGPYTDWIANWTSEPFAAYVSWLGSRVDEQAFGADERTKRALRDVFRRTVRFEIAFWDACLGEA